MGCKYGLEKYFGERELVFWKTWLTIIRRANIILKVSLLLAVFKIKVSSHSSIFLSLVLATCSYICDDPKQFQSFSASEFKHLGN